MKSTLAFIFDGVERLKGFELVAFEISTGRIKYFNLERITDVQVKAQRMSNESKHEDVKPDVFGFGEKAKSYEKLKKYKIVHALFNESLITLKG